MSLRVSSNSVWNSKTGKLYENFLFPTQIEVLNEARRNIILEFGTSSGKTFISLHVYQKFSKAPLLIVAPRAKVDTKDWDKSIRFFKEKYECEFEYVVETPDKIKSSLNLYKGWYVIIDECHMVKNSTSQRGKSALKLTQQSDGFCLLSATPLGNGWIDSINFFKIFGLTKNKTQFLKEFALQETKVRADGRRYPEIIGWQKEEQLAEMWHSIAIERPTSYFVDLPEMIEEFVEFNKSSMYKRFEKDRLIEHENGDIEPLDNLSKLNAARRKHGNSKAKMDYLSVLLERSENILIFYNFNKERDEIHSLLKKYKKTVFENSGHVKKLPDENDWDNLENTVTVVQYKSGAAALELQYNSVVVLYSPTYSYMDYVQAMGRAHRLGGHRLTVYKFKVKGTIDTQIYKALDNKQDFKDSLYEEEAE